MDCVADIKQTLKGQHACASQKKVVSAMLRPHDFEDGRAWLMMKLGYTTPPRQLMQHRLRAGPRHWNMTKERRQNVPSTLVLALLLQACSTETTSKHIAAMDKYAP